MITWEAILQLAIVTIVLGGGGYAWLLYQSRKLDREFPPKVDEKHVH